VARAARRKTIYHLTHTIRSYRKLVFVAHLSPLYLCVAPGTTTRRAPRCLAQKLVCQG
jgi:hypothetical protein